MLIEPQPIRCDTRYLPDNVTPTNGSVTLATRYKIGLKLCPCSAGYGSPFMVRFKTRKKFKAALDTGYISTTDTRLNLPQGRNDNNKFDSFDAGKGMCTESSMYWGGSARGFHWVLERMIQCC